MINNQILQFSTKTKESKNSRTFMRVKSLNTNLQKTRSGIQVYNKTNLTNDKKPILFLLKSQKRISMKKKTMTESRNSINSENKVNLKRKLNGKLREKTTLRKRRDNTLEKDNTKEKNNRQNNLKDLLLLSFIKINRTKIGSNDKSNNASKIFNRMHKNLNEKA